MTRDQIVLLAVCGLALLCLVLLVALVRVRAAALRTATDLRLLRERVDDLARKPDVSPEPEAAHAAPLEFVITDLGQPQAPAEPVPPGGPAFADIVLKETVVKAASFAHGVRRGLAPATRNRIRFEMRQEVRRSRKQRRSDLKAAQRDLHARQRAALPDDDRQAS